MILINVANARRHPRHGMPGPEVTPGPSARRRSLWRRSRRRHSRSSAGLLVNGAAVPARAMARQPTDCHGRSHGSRSCCFGPFRAHALLIGHPARMRESRSRAQGGRRALCVLLWARPGADDGLVAYEDQVLGIAGGHGCRVLQRARSSGAGGGPLIWALAVPMCVQIGGGAPGCGHATGASALPLRRAGQPWTWARTAKPRVAPFNRTTPPWISATWMLRKVRPLIAAMMSCSSAARSVSGSSG